MKKLITLSLLIFLGYSSSFSQKKLKGKEIGIDLRNFNNNGNINFLIRKDTKDSFIKKRKNISFSSVKPGDLVFFGKPISHVAIYMGGGKMVHAPRPGKRVEVVEFPRSFGRKPFVGAKRI